MESPLREWRDTETGVGKAMQVIQGPSPPVSSSHDLIYLLAQGFFLLAQRMSHLTGPGYCCSGVKDLGRPLQQDNLAVSLARGTEI